MIIEGQITRKTKIFLDNTSVIDKVNQKQPLHPFQEEWDILEPTRKIVQKQKLEVNHVRGHQNMEDISTTREARLNHHADKLANRAHQDHAKIGIQPTGYRILLYIQGEPVTTKMVQEIQRAGTTPALRNYYRNKHGWTDSTMATIDWQGLTRALKKFTHSKQRMLHKYIHGWLPTNDHMHRRYGTSKTCTQCGQIEGALHIIMCTTRRQQKDNFLEKLKIKMEQMQTDTGLQHLLLQMLNGQVNQPDKREIQEEIWPMQLRSEQTNIGVEKLWQGFFTQTWGTYRKTNTEPPKQVTTKQEENGYKQSSMKSSSMLIRCGSIEMSRYMIHIRKRPHTDNI